MVNRQENIDTHRKRSSVISTFEITTDAQLKGSVRHYVEIESRVPMDQGTYNTVLFNIRGNNNSKSTGSVLLELYIV